MIGGHLSARRPPALTITTWHGTGEFASSWTHTCRRKHLAAQTHTCPVVRLTAEHGTRIYHQKVKYTIHTRYKL